MSGAALVGLACLVLQAAPFTTLVGPAEGERPGRHFAFLVDVSGSMKPDRINKAVQAALLIGSQNTEGMELCVFSFAEVSVKWHRKWVKLPDTKVIDDLSGWIRNQKMTGSTLKQTYVVPSLVHALKQDKRELTVVIISDGQFHFDGYMAEATLEREQKKRVARGLPRAMVIAMSVGKKSQSQTMQALGRAGKGGCYLWNDPKQSAKRPSEKSSKRQPKASPPAKRKRKPGRNKSFGKPRAKSGRH